MRSKIVLKSLAAAIVMIGLLMVSVPASAHHGTGISYDLTKLVESKGVIRELRVSQPPRPTLLGRQRREGRDRSLERGDERAQQFGTRGLDEIRDR